MQTTNLASSLSIKRSHIEKNVSFQKRHEKIIFQGKKYFIFFFSVFTKINKISEVKKMFDEKKIKFNIFFIIFCDKLSNTSKGEIKNYQKNTETVLRHYDENYNVQRLKQKFYLQKNFKKIIGNSQF